MKTVLVLLQSSAGIAIFRLYCGHPKHQIYVAGGSTSNLRQALIWTDGHTDHNGTNITQRYLKAITKFTSNTT